MKLLPLFSLFSSFVLAGFASAALQNSQDAAASFVTQARAAEARFDPRAALELFRQADALRPNDAAILQAISKQLSDELDQIPVREERLRVAHEALGFAERAHQLVPRESLYALSIAVCEGKIALDADNRDKLAASREVKTWADAALALDPQSDWAEHVLGKWHLEVSHVGATKRAFARLIYGEVPPATLAEALQHLQKSVSLNSANASHHIELGFAYQENGDSANARREFTTGLGLPSHDLPDETAKTRARTALAKL